jgi:hypothetical protein
LRGKNVWRRPAGFIFWFFPSSRLALLFPPNDLSWDEGASGQLSASKKIKSHLFITKEKWKKTESQLNKTVLQESFGPIPHFLTNGLPNVQMDACMHGAYYAKKWIEASSWRCVRWMGPARGPWPGF